MQYHSSLIHPIVLFIKFATQSFFCPDSCPNMFLYLGFSLPFQATPEQIQHAYRHFSRIYHPDKHTDPARKKEAETLFQKTKYAYEGV